MVTKSKLKMALAAEKGVDFSKLDQKKKAKLARKKANKQGGAKPAKVVEEEVDEEDDDQDDDWEAAGSEEEEDDDAEGGAPVSDDDEDDDDEDSEEEELDIAALDDSESSESEIEFEAKIQRKPKANPSAAVKAVEATKASSKKAKKANDVDEDEEDEDEEDEEDIPMSDLEDLPEDEKEDLIPHTRLTINNTAALLASLKRIALPTDKSVAFATHQTIVSAEPTAAGIEDIQDDLKRELAFYAQCLDAAKRGRALLRAEGVPFSRPNDYFAEMVKDDPHMEKVKAKLIEAASNKKAAAEARKLRDLKKFGKQVQVAKMQERQKAKKDTLEKIKSLKRKRQESSADVGAREADLFDVGVEDELQKHQTRRPFAGGRDGDRSANPKRQKKDQKYGFGGKKRHAKSGDAISSSDMSGFSTKRMKSGTKGKVGKTARLGKNRRKAVAAKR